MLKLLVFSSSSVSLCGFLPHCLCISISARLPFPAFHSLAPSLHGRVVINPYFIAENSSLAARLTAPHVLRHGEDQTQSSLPPSRHLCLHLALITEIVEGWRGWVGGDVGGRDHTITPEEREGGTGGCTTC